MAEEKKKSFWAGSSLIFVLIVGTIASAIVKELRHKEVSNKSYQGMKRLQNETEKMSPEEYNNFLKIKEDAMKVFFSKLSPQEAERGTYLVGQLAKGITTSDEMNEWSMFFKKARGSFTPDEMVVWKRYEELALKLAKIKTPYE